MRELLVLLIVPSLKSCFSTNEYIYIIYTYTAEMRKSFIKKGIESWGELNEEW